MGFVQVAKVTQKVLRSMLSSRMQKPHQQRTCAKRLRGLWMTEKSLQPLMMNTFLAYEDGWWSCGGHVAALHRTLTRCAPSSMSLFRGSGYKTFVLVWAMLACRADAVGCTSEACSCR